MSRTTRSKAKKAADEKGEKDKNRSNNEDDIVMNHNNEDDGDNDADSSSTKTSGDTDAENEECEPKPVSSDSENDDDDDNDDGTAEKQQQQNAMKNQRSGSTTTSGMSRLFAPYRTLGVISSGRPFHLIPHENSKSSMICIPIGDRFQLMQTDRLQPVLVSQAVPASIMQTKRQQRSKQHLRHNIKEEISHCVTDPTLSITVASHGPVRSPNTITLYQRTRPIQTQSVLNRDMMNSKDIWSIQSLLHIGRIKMEMTGEKEGRNENAAVIVAVLSKRKHVVDIDGDDGIPVVGDDDDSSPEEDQDQDRDDDVDDDDGSNEEEDSVVPENNEKETEESCCGQVVVLVATRTMLQIHRRIRLSTLPTLRPMTSMHPATYLNKIVIGGFDDETGNPVMCLVNVRSSKVVHTFKCLSSRSATSDSRGKKSKILVIEQSPAVDTVALGTDDGTVHLVNLRHDKLLFSLKHKVAVTSISFRTDGSAMRYAIAPLAVGRSDGTITVWDLTPPEDCDAGRTILTEMDRVHPGGIAKLQYLPQEPLLVSIGTRSNRVMIHIFDNPNHSGRILRQRNGQTAPPTIIRYLHQGSGAVLVNDGTDASTCQILSAGGQDRTLRVFSTVRSVLDKEYSQGSGLEKKAKKFGLNSTAELLLPPVKNMALSDCRSRDWGDLVTIHEDHSFAYVWSTKRGAQSGPVLKQPGWNVSAMKIQPPTETNATSITMSACGNFALVGTRGGIIYKYNVQSGIRRGCYPRDLNESDSRSAAKPRAAAGDIRRTMKALEKKMKISNRESNLDKKDVDAVHEGKLEQQRQLKLQQASHTGFAVVGLAVDSVNKTLISVGTDRKLILWSFSTHAPHKKSPFMLPCAATRLCHIRESDLAAIALEDFSVILFDCTSLTIVRRFGVTGSRTSHSGLITDLGFSPDGRTLYTSSLDSTIRVFDVPTNKAVDWLKFKSPPTSITISPTGEFLATTHSGQLGISLWSDRSYYQTVHVDGSAIVEPSQMDEPVPISDSQDFSGTKRSLPSYAESTTMDASGDNYSDGAPEDNAPEPKGEGLITFSGLPPAHWKNLFHLELVKERNKPQEPPKKPPTAPFFLQWRSGEAVGGTPENLLTKEADNASKGENEEEWAAAWSDDDDGNGWPKDGSAVEDEKVYDLEAQEESRQLARKKPKVSHYRSHLASLLQQCSKNSVLSDERRFQEVTEYVATIGPSAIDVSLSSLCNGSHDLEEGVPLLLLACEWFVEACQSRERFEVVNAYLHRFLHVHAPVIAEIDNDLKDAGTGESLENKVAEEHQKLIESLSQLRVAQHAASAVLDEKLKHAICLVRHFSRMV